jgi:hypothetical protein
MLASFEMIYIRTALCYISQNGNIHKHCCESLKSYAKAVNIIAPRSQGTLGLVSKQALILQSVSVYYSGQKMEEMHSPER